VRFGWQKRFADYLSETEKLPALQTFFFVRVVHAQVAVADPENFTLEGL
jgi:hypothetical protein